MKAKHKNMIDIALESLLLIFYIMLFILPFIASAAFFLLGGIAWYEGIEKGKAILIIGILAIYGSLMMYWIALERIRDEFPNLKK